MESDGNEPRWIQMEDDELLDEGNIEPGERYHDLGIKYPNPPIPIGYQDTIIHRAILKDLTGVSIILDWISDGDMVVIEMSELMKRETELNIAVSKIRDFVELDLSGTVLLLGKTRLLLLPPKFSSSLEII